ncbi:hypothetical protein [Actinoplanes sp. HUAS TT8]|uniref:hypothetical protein n=1 Tax=Actinoplanes sp. HUAS TT8 TaxID=3447453 RepID=UPI003F526738
MAVVMFHLSSPGPSLAGDQPLLYLVLAGFCVIIGLRFLKRAMEPFGVVLEAAAAAAVVAFSLGIALVLLLAAIVAR